MSNHSWQLPAIFSLFFALPASAVTGDQDPSYLPHVYSNEPSGKVSALAVIEDGSALVGSSVAVAPSVPGPWLKQISSGAEQVAFSTVSPRSDRGHLLRQWDGKTILIEDSWLDVPANGIRRLNADGSSDPTFVANVTAGRVLAADLQSDGKIVIGGDFQSVNGHLSGKLARLNVDGTLDTSFNPVVDGTVNALKIQPDGKILVGGDFDQINGQARRNLARLTAAGVPDQTFVSYGGLTSGSGSVEGILLSPDGDLFVSGNFTGVLVQLGPDGSLKKTLSLPGAGPRVTTMVLQSDGKLLVGGRFGLGSGEDPHRGVSRLLTDGTPDPSFTSPFHDKHSTVMFGPHAHALALQEDGRILLGLMGGLNAPDYNAARAKLNSLLIRLENETSDSVLSVTDVNTVEWHRGGTAPEVSEVRFEASADGLIWNLLGHGNRVAGGWRLSGIPVPQTGFVRACGRTFSGYRCGSSGMVSRVISVTAGTPRIELVSPDGTAVSDDSGQLNMGGLYTDRIFKIRNVGTGDLLVEDIVFTHLSHSRITIDMSSTQRRLGAGEETEFSVFVDPVDFKAGESVRVTLQVRSNDSTNPELGFAMVGGMALSPVAELEGMALYLRPEANSRHFIVPPFVVRPGVFEYTLPVRADTVLAGVEIFAPRHLASIFRVRINGLEKTVYSKYIDFEIGIQDTPVVLEFRSPNTTNWATYILTPVRSSPAFGMVDLAYTAGAISDLGTPHSLDVKNRVMTSSHRLTAQGGKDENYHVGEDRKVTRMLPDGGLLTTDGQSVFRYSANGRQMWCYAAPGQVESLDQMADGSFLLGGSFSRAGLRPVGLLKLAASGIEDRNFTSPVLGEVYTHLLTSDGKLLVGGSFGLRTGDTIYSLARFSSNGLLDETFTPSASDTPVKGMLLQKDGKVVVYGDFNSYASQPASCIARVLANGLRDAAFVVSAEISSVKSAVLLANGNLVLAAGGFDAVETGSSRLIALLPGGTLTSSFTTTYLDGSGGELGLVSQEDGSLLIGGDVRSANEVPVPSVARIYGAGYSKYLTIFDSRTVRWNRAGGISQALRMWYECSIDNGMTWQWLGEGEWIENVQLPAAGKLRARALVQGGPFSRSQGIVETTQDFSFAPASLELSYMSPDAALDFGEVAVGWSVDEGTSVENEGEVSLNGIQIKISGPGAGSFFLMNPPGKTIAPGERLPINFRFVPTQPGLVRAKVTISTADGRVNPVTFNLKATGIAGKKAAATTLASRPVTDDLLGQVLQGRLETQTMSDEHLFFEYSSDKSLVSKGHGTVKEAVPVSNNGAANATVEATLSGLNPNTRYYYRVRLSSPQGGAAGAVLSFVTGNRPPVAVADTLRLLPGGALVLPVLGNDSDADGDAFSIATVSAVEPATAGSVSLVKNLLQFNPGKEPADCSFIYQTKDVHGALSLPVSVQILVEKTASLTPEKTVTAAGEVYDLGLSSEAHWTVQNALNWVSVDARSGYGDRVFQVTVRPNSTKESRIGALYIGGLAHRITQTGIERPVLVAPQSPVPQPFVASSYLLSIPTTGLPVTYSVKNLPPGLTLSGNTGLISGVPTRAGNYQVIVQARNAAGTAPEPVSFELEVAALQPEFIGRHEGWLGIDSPELGGLGGRYELTVTSSGSLTGKLMQAGKTETFKGLLTVTAERPNKAQALAFLPSLKNGPLRILEVDFDAANDGSNNIRVISNEVETAWGEGWWIPWNGKDQQASSFVESYTFVLPAADAETTAPEGHGFGRMEVTRAGIAKIIGHLADGSTFTCSSALSRNGDCVLYQGLYKSTGVLLGALKVSSGETVQNNSVGGDLQWLKFAKAPQARDLVYSTGFGPLQLRPAGGVRLRLLPGAILMNLSGGGTVQASLDFSGGGLSADFEANAVITNPSAKGMTNKVQVVASAEAVQVNRLDTKTGQFSGSFTLTGSTPALTRKTAFSGQAVQIDGVVKGYGFFLLPELPPEGGSLKTSPLQSGAVLFQAAPPP